MFATGSGADFFRIVDGKTKFERVQASEMLGKTIKAVEKLFDLKITRASLANKARFADLSSEMRAAIDAAQRYTMTSPERLAVLCMAVEHVVRNDIPGAFVECGVWRGGSSMAAALTYRRLKREDVDLYLFDTFEGMSTPGEEDIQSSTGVAAKQLLAVKDRQAEVWAYAPLEGVRRTMQGTGYPSDRLHFVQGKVEETIPDCAPEKISILRLDTDWYESTKHELVHLFPRLSMGGILIIDDYGDWQGARKATDEYFAENGMSPFLSRIDSTGRVYEKH